MKTRFLFIIILLMQCSFIFGANVYQSEIFSSKIKTLRIQKPDDWLSAPVIGLEDGSEIEISFDELGAHPSHYVYDLIHCNADWTRSQLIQSEYMSGFSHTLVDEYTNSFNTVMDYVNYKIYFPNPNTTMKVSGNYVVLVYDENDLKTPVLTACFSVVEPETDINMSVTTNTDIDFNKAHQQVEFNIQHNLKMNSPIQELKVYVTQNNRRDNMAKLVEPLNIQNKNLVYAHNKKLIFEAGNEYRRFEIITNRYNGINIEHIEYHSPYYHAIIYPDQIRANRNYSYDEDINGRFYIRNSDAVDYDFEADYNFVHFTLPCEKPFPYEVYMLSDIYNNELNDKSKLKYNIQNQAYEADLILKQGQYNYMYVTKKESSESAPASTALIEGNYFQTENEYTLYVYHRPFGGRFDKLIGTKTVRYHL